MSALSSANVTDVNLVLKERTHMRLCQICLNMLIFTHNLGNWLIASVLLLVRSTVTVVKHVVFHLI